MNCSQDAWGWRKKMALVLTAPTRDMAGKWLGKILMTAPDDRWAPPQRWNFSKLSVNHPGGKISPPFKQPSLWSWSQKQASLAKLVGPSIHSPCSVSYLQMRSLSPQGTEKKKKPNQPKKKKQTKRDPAYPQVILYWERKWQFIHSDPGRQQVWEEKHGIDFIYQQHRETQVLKISWRLHK